MIQDNGFQLTAKRYINETTIVVTVKHTTTREVFTFISDFDGNNVLIGSDGVVIDAEKTAYAQLLIDVIVELSDRCMKEV